MKRMRIIGIVIFMLFALPLWRLIDWAIILWPQTILFSLLMILWSMAFVATPLRLLRPKTHFAWYPVIFILFATLAYLSGPLSGMAAQSDQHVHCGRASYTGFFYPFKHWLSNVHQDDLEARNQLCWVRKMITRIPKEFENPEDLENYYKLIEKRLLAPENKYRIVLPAVLVLSGKIISNWDMEDEFLDKIKTGRVFYQELHRWSAIYNLEIRDRRYHWWEAPHAWMMRTEYGLVENNWQSILDKIKFEVI